MHPFIIHGKHLINKLIIHSEHLRMLHAGSTLLSSSLSSCFHIIYMRKTVHSIVHHCITCRHYTCKPQYQLLGQLPLERVTPGSVFQKVGVDYAGLVKIKYGMIRKPTIIKAYICVFVSLSQSGPLRSCVRSHESSIHCYFKMFYCSSRLSHSSLE